MRFRRKRSDGILDPSERTFNAMMELVKDLTLKDYRKLKKAMDSGYEAYQIVRGLETDEVDDAEYQLSKDKEVK